MAVEADPVLSGTIDPNIERFLDEATDFYGQPVLVLNPFNDIFWTTRPKWHAQLGVLDDPAKPEIEDYDLSAHPNYGALILPSLVDVSQVHTGSHSQARVDIIGTKLAVGLPNFEANSIHQGWRPAHGKLGTFVIAGGKNIRNWVYTDAMRGITYKETDDGRDKNLIFDTTVRQMIETELDILENHS